MSKKQRDSLLENMDSPYNPFELLQTIDIREKPTNEGNKNSFGLSQPKQAKRKSKTNKKRPSAPAKTLQQQKPSNQDEDLLNLFGGDLFAEQKKQPSKQQDPFSLFDESQPRESLKTPDVGFDPRSSVNSVTTEQLFDINMWGFDDPNAAPPVQKFQPNQMTVPGTGPTRSKQRGKSTPHVQPLTTAKKRADPIGLQTLKEEGKDGSSSDDSGDIDDDSDAPTDSDDDDKRSKKSKPIRPTSPGRRYSAPAHQPVKPGTNVLAEMHRGTALLKYPRRHGFPHFKHVQLSRDNQRLQWFSKRKSLDDTCIWIKDIREVLQGQKTEVFRKFKQELLEKASFSVVFSHDYKTLDVVAKSTDECDMWVKGLNHLVQAYRNGKDLTKLTQLDVGIQFKDRNRPKSRRGSGNFIRANNSKQLKIDPIALKQIERDMDQLHKSYHRVAQLAQKPNITRSDEFHNIQQVLSELEERIEELTHEVSNTRDTEMSKRDVWRANVDLTAIQEKIEVLLKYYNSSGRPKY